MKSYKGPKMFIKGRIEKKMTLQLLAGPKFNGLTLLSNIFCLEIIFLLKNKRKTLKDLQLPPPKKTSIP